MFEDLEKSTKQGLQLLKDGIGDDGMINSMLSINISLYLKEKEKTGQTSEYMEAVIKGVAEE